MFSDWLKASERGRSCCSPWTGEQGIAAKSIRFAPGVEYNSEGPLDEGGASRHFSQCFTSNSSVSMTW